MLYLTSQQTIKDTQKSGTLIFMFCKIVKIREKIENKQIVIINNKNNDSQALFEIFRTKWKNLPKH